MINKFLRNPEWRSGLIFGSSSIFAGIVSMILGIMMIRWIEPTELGIWQSLSIIQLYIPFVEIGVPNGLNRELPYLYGKGEREKGRKYAQTAQSFMIAVSLFLFVATGITVMVLFSIGLELKIIAGVATVGLMVSVNAYQRYLVVTYRSAQSFMSLSRLYSYQTMIQLIFFPLVWYYHYYGLLFYSFIVLFLFTFLMHIGRPIPSKPDFIKDHLKALIKTGLPVFLMGYIRSVSNSFTRIILLIKGGTLSVGLFTPVNAIGTLIVMLPGVLGNFFFPKMNHILGATNNPKELWPIVLKINAILLAFSIPFIFGVWSVTPYVVTTYFEKYQEAIPAMKVFSLNFLFSGTLVSHNVIYSVKAYALGYAFVGIEFVLRFLCPYAFVCLMQGNVLTLTAYGVLVSNGVLFCLNIVFIRWALMR